MLEMLRIFAHSLSKVNANVVMNVHIGKFMSVFDFIYNVDYFSHDTPKPVDDKLSVQNIKDRFYGTNDPVAEKLLSRAKAAPKLVVPTDQSITTLYIGNLGSNGELVVNEQDLRFVFVIHVTLDVIEALFSFRNHFYQFGEIRQIHVLHNKFCAFIDFLTREGAELAAERSFNLTIINGQKLSIRWGRPQAQTRFEGTEDKKKFREVPNLPGALPLPSFDEAGPSSSKRPRAEVITADEAGPFKTPRLVVPNVAPKAATNQPANSSQVYYPSQDPYRLGTKAPL